MAERKKSELDVVIYYKGNYYYLHEEEWQKAEKLSEGERSVLVPLVENGAVVAHVEQESPRFGTWSNLVNMDSLMAMKRPKKAKGD